MLVLINDDGIDIRRHYLALDISLPSHIYGSMQQKIDTLNTESVKAGLKRNSKKAKVLDEFGGKEAHHF